MQLHSGGLKTIIWCSMVLLIIAFILQEQDSVITYSVCFHLRAQIKASAESKQPSSFDGCLKFMQIAGKNYTHLLRNAVENYQLWSHFALSKHIREFWLKFRNVHHRTDQKIKMGQVMLSKAFLKCLFYCPDSKLNLHVY